MSSLKFRHQKSNFKALDLINQQRLFNLGCFEMDHMLAGFPARMSEIEQEIEGALETLYGESAWRAIENRGDTDSVHITFEQGDAVNYMLAWYLEGEFEGYSCKPESHSNQSEFDVTILDNGVPVCGIELKRAGSSNRITRYLDEHRTKCEGPRDAPCFLLANLFPISEKMDPVRASDLVIGYGPLSARTHKFYQQECSYVANIPAPLFQANGNKGPLRQIRDILVDELDVLD